ncbi:MAG: DUF3352 domain-containing protein [candidate division KSB1 bacterium]|nr:DUF3352 domain-containing protein [candidate division KSB1 bacterium]MDZ7273765.1 DUF3352 domain-containing protein [candidate division KSB1 bacterium]MDZ7285921.1 DUF3352 domain-containing protein [candidate division KSB1 bacterium]MDZ7298953.1 DUF3352 domain-containing protein [candidate division KSB1 bacterium]MDZ7349902.1 DUF3352 domain-containing protein [candidate division KSB1 bacterium]
MKKQQVLWLAVAVLAVLAVAVGWYLLRSKAGEAVTTALPEAQEVRAPQIVLRELQQPKADEEKFLEAVRRETGAAYDSLTPAQQLAVLLRLADDQETTNRLLAVRRLGEWQTPNPERDQKLVARLQDESMWVVEEAVLALLNVRPPAAVEPLRRLWSDLQARRQAEYVPLRETGLLLAHGRIHSSGANSGTELLFELTAHPKHAPVQSSVAGRREKLARGVPGGFDLCLFAPHFKENWEKLQNSRFVQQLTALQAWQDFKAAEPFSHVFQLGEQLDQQLGMLGGKFNYFIDPLGEEVCLASYPAGNDNRWLLVTPANLKAQTVTRVLAALGTFESRELSVSSQTYRQHTLFTVASQRRGALFYYTLVEDFLMVATDRELLVRAIASFLDAEESSLAFQPAFRAAEPQIGPASCLLVFLDPDKYFGLTAGGRSAASLAEMVARALEQITGEAPAGSSDSLPAPVPAIPTPALAEETLRFIPGDAIFCCATSAIFPEKFWHYVTTMRAEREAIRGFETRSNLNLGRDLIGKLDPQVLYFFAGIDTSGPRYFWRQLAGVRLRQTQGVEACVKKLLVYFYSPTDGLLMEEYQGVRLHYIKSPTTFEPNFAISGDYLLFAFDRPTLRAAIDASRNRTPAITQNAGFAAARQRLQAAEHTLAYFNATAFCQNYRDYLAAYDRQTHLFDQADLHSRIDPLFDLIKASAPQAASKFSAAGNGELVWSMK